MKLETLKLSELNPAEYNPRTITKEEFEGLKQSLKTFGQQENLIVNKDMTVISGHQRLEAMKALGWTEAVCNMVDLDKHAEKKLNVIMNSTAISGKYDDLKLSEILEELKLDDDYESLRLNKLEPLDLSDIEVEEDEAPEVSTEPPVSKLGEVYQLGRHRVMCADSTLKENVEKLMDGKKADMVFTDPPYGVAMKRSGTIMNDDISPEALQDIINSAVVNSMAFAPSAPMYWWIGFRAYSMMESILVKNGASVSNCIVWVKPSIGMGKTGYRFRHELCIYTGDVADKSLSDVWEFGRDNSDLHPTMKPIELVAHGIKNSSRPSGIVLDLFLGSGSTLIACEQTDRICYGMELDEKYVDVCRRRYWKFVNDGDDTGWAENTPAL